MVYPVIMDLELLGYYEKSTQKSWAVQRAQTRRRLAGYCARCALKIDGKSKYHCEKCKQWQREYSRTRRPPR